MIKDEKYISTVTNLRKHSIFRKSQSNFICCSLSLLSHGIDLLIEAFGFVLKKKKMLY